MHTSRERALTVTAPAMVVRPPRQGARSVGESARSDASRAKRSAPAHPGRQPRGLGGAAGAAQAVGGWVYGKEGRSDKAPRRMTRPDWMRPGRCARPWSLPGDLLAGNGSVQGQRSGQAECRLEPNPCQSEAEARGKDAAPPWAPHKTCAKEGEHPARGCECAVGVWGQDRAPPEGVRGARVLGEGVRSGAFPGLGSRRNDERSRA